MEILSDSLEIAEENIRNILLVDQLSKLEKTRH